MEGERLWALLEERGIRWAWLVARTGIPAKRFYNLKWSAGPGRDHPNRARWRPEEMEAVSRALGKSRRWLFGPAPTVRGVCIACGKAGRVQPLRCARPRGALVPRRQDQATGSRAQASGS